MFTTVYSPRPANCAAGDPIVGEGLVENIFFSLIMGVCFEIVNQLIPGIFLPMFYKGYSKLLEKDRMSWDVKFTNVLFSLVIVPLAYYCRNYDDALIACPTNGTSHLVRLCSALTVGFFIWDVVVCVRYLKDWGVAFLFHGVFCLTIYLQVAWFQVTVAHAFGALYYEASTPFLNARWYMQQAKAYKHPFFNYLTYAFASAFIGVRIFFGGFHTYSILIMCTEETCLPLFARVIASIVIVCSFGLNCKWAFDIVVSATKVRKTKTGEKSS
jgi:hypothetical protein